MRTTPLILFFPLLFILLSSCTGLQKITPADSATELQTTESQYVMDWKDTIKIPSSKVFSQYQNRFGWTLRSKPGQWAELPNLRTERGLPVATLRSIEGPQVLVRIYDAAVSREHFIKEELPGALGYLFKVEPDSAQELWEGYSINKYNSAFSDSLHWARSFQSDSNLVFLFVQYHDPAHLSASKALPGLSFSREAAQPPVDEDKIFEGALYNTVGLLSVQDSNYHRAMGLFQSALRIEPDYIPYLINLSAMYRALEEWAAGAQFLESHWQLVKTSSFLSGILGDFYEQTGQYGAARQWADHALTLDPGNEDWLINLSDALWRLGEKVQSKNILLEQARTRPSRRLSLYLAGTHLGLEEFQQAHALLSKMEPSGPPEKKYCEYLMLSLNGLGRFPETLTFFRGKVARDSVTARMLVQKARAEFSLKNYLIAEFTLKKALKLDPGDEEGQQLWTQVRSLIGAKTNIMLKEPIGSLFPSLSVGTLKKMFEKHREEIQSGSRILLMKRNVKFLWKPNEKWKKSTQLLYFIPPGNPMVQLPELTFELNANHSRLFVNQFDIYDTTFKKIKNGDVDDFYITKIHDNTVHPENMMVHLPIKVEQGPLFIATQITEESRYGNPEFPYLSYTTKNTFPFLDNTFEILNPVGVLNLHTFGDIKVDSNAKSISMIFPHEPAASPEIFAPNFEEYGSGFSIAPLKSWRESGDEYLAYLEEKGVHYDSVPFAILEQSHEVISQAPSGISRAEALFRYVRDIILYDNFEFNLHALIPENSRVVNEKKTGDCKGHALLLTHLLRANGIPALLTLVSHESHGYPNLPTLHQFNHMLVYYRDTATQAEYFLDATEKYQPFRASPLTLEGKNALVLERGNSRLITIPELNNPGEHGARVSHTITGLDSNKLEGVDSLVLRGKFASDFREQIDQWEKIGKLEVLMSWLTDGYPGYWMGELYLHREQAIDSDLVIALRYTQELPDTTLKAKIPISTKLEKSLFRYPDARDRKTPIYFPFHILVESSWHFKGPESAVIDHNLSPRNNESDHLLWTRHFTQNKKSSLDVIQSWKLKPFLAQPDKYQKIHAQWESIFAESSFELAIH